MIDKDNFLRKNGGNLYKKSDYYSQFPSTTYASKHKLIDRNYKRAKEKVWDFYAEGKFKKPHPDDIDATSNLQLQTIADRQAHLNARIDRDLEQTWGLLTKIRSNLDKGVGKANNLIDNLGRWADGNVTVKARNCTWEAQKNREFDLDEFGRLEEEIAERRFGDYAVLGEAGRGARRRFLGDNFQEHFLGEGEVYRELLYKKKIYDDIVHGQDLHYMPKEFFEQDAIYGKNSEINKYQRAEVLQFKPRNKREEERREKMIRERICEPLRADSVKTEEAVVEFQFSGLDSEKGERDSDLRKQKFSQHEIKIIVDEDEEGEELSLRGQQMIMYDVPKRDRGKGKQPVSVKDRFDKMNESDVPSEESQKLGFHFSKFDTTEKKQPSVVAQGDMDMSFLQVPDLSSRSKDQTATIQAPVFYRHSSHQDPSKSNLNSSFNDSEVNLVVQQDLRRIREVEYSTIEEQGQDNVTFEVEVARFIQPTSLEDPSSLKDPSSKRKKSSARTDEEGLRLIQKTLHIEKTDRSYIDQEKEESPKEDHGFKIMEPVMIAAGETRALKFVKNEPELVVDVNAFKDEKGSVLDEEEIKRKNDKINFKIFEFKEKWKEQEKVKLMPTVDEIVRKMEKEGVFTPRVNNFELKKPKAEIVNPRKLTKREVEIAQLLALERERDLLRKKIENFEKNKEEHRQKMREMDRKKATVMPPPASKHIYEEEPNIKTQKRPFYNPKYNDQEPIETQSSLDSYKFDFSGVNLDKIEPTRHFMSINTLANDNNIYAADYLERQNSHMQRASDETEEEIRTKEKFYTEDKLKRYLMPIENPLTANIRESSDASNGKETESHESQFTNDRLKSLVAPLVAPSVKDIKIENEYTYQSNSYHRNTNSQINSSNMFGSLQKNFDQEGYRINNIDFTRDPNPEELDFSIHDSNSKGLKLSSKPPLTRNQSGRATEGSKLFNYTMTDDDRRDTVGANQSLTFIVDPFDIGEKQVHDADSKILDFGVESEAGNLGESRLEEYRESIDTYDHDDLLGEIAEANIDFEESPHFQHN